jgi:cytochrome c oxidase subunit 2
MKRFSLITAVCLVASSATAFAQTAPAVAQGKKLFDSKKCTECHTIAGKGGTVTKQYPLDGVGAKLSETDIKKWFTNTTEMEAKLEKQPKTKMTSKKIPLTDAEVTALVAYMQTLKEAPKGK